MESQTSFISVDEFIEIVSDGSQPITPRPKVTPVLSQEEQALADAVKRYQIDRRRALLNWRDIFEIVQSLGYRKVEPPAAPPGSNGDPKENAHGDGTATETPS